MDLRNFFSKRTQEGLATKPTAVKKAKVILEKDENSVVEKENIAAAVSMTPTSNTTSPLKEKSEEVPKTAKLEKPLEKEGNSSSLSKLPEAKGAARIEKKSGKPCKFFYSQLASAFEKIEATTKRLEIQEILTTLFKQVFEACKQNEGDSGIDLSPLESVVLLSSNKVAPDFEGIEIGVGEGLLTKCLVSVTGRNRKAISSKYEEVGDLGLVAQQFKKTQKSLFGHKPQPLTIKRVHDDVLYIAKNSLQDKKLKKMEKLLVSATPVEAKYLVRCMQGKLRIGLAEQTVLISLATALCQKKNKEEIEKGIEIVKQVYSEVPIYGEIIRHMVDLGGAEGLRERCHVRAGIPLKPMLAKPTNGVSQVLDRFDGVEFTCEYKYDGERAQIHLLENGSLTIYSRNSENNTEKYPDLAKAMPLAVNPEKEVKSYIMDSEVVAYCITKKKILPFQVLSTRSRKGVEIEDIKVQVIVCAFDLLYLNGESLLETPLRERRRILKEHFIEVPDKFSFATSFDGKSEEDIAAFLNKAVEGSCEGLMVKTLEDTYQPARRSLNWLKLKKDYMNNLADSLDLVPIGAFYGKGKRTGVYGAYILASYNEDEGEFQSITKIGTGFSDTALKEHTAFFENHVLNDKPSNYVCDMSPDVWLNSVQVWEVRAADLSISPIHKAAIGLVDASKGIALRFPRFLRIRDDKEPEMATDQSQVKDMYLQQSSVQNSE
eukprot:CAMPEP_0184019092 /NCGR_PEP_ID=MMETSP0954-20121128/8549_1 /TAXON_ID=627963 /ORGANISM="Aplanochytrium sp, Strain PBS07" /LENGTH=714 /DNA_ID=CAMNT_0026300699 /DNA_START=62 /DNA_END=2206 /DNA_ORIENTATION=-